jgi:putative peptidoglycan lipid II flippase
MTPRLTRSAGVIGLATLTSRVLGLGRDVLIGLFFGTGHAADAFGVATRVPTLLRDLFAEGAMSAAFVPTFARSLTRDGKEAAWRLGSQVINALALVTGALVVLGIVFAAPLASTLAGDYAAVPGKLETTIRLTQVNMPFLLLIAIAAAFMGMLNALRRFVVPAMSPAMYNVVFIACTAAGVPLFGRLGLDPVMALSVGMLAGGVAQIAVQWPTLRREGYRHSWILNPRDPALHEVLVLMGPGTIGVAAAQVNLFVNTVLATNEPGAVAALQYAFRLMYLPIGIFGVSVATAAIPELARHAAKGEHDDMRRTLSWGLRVMLMLSVPAAVGLMVLDEPIVELIYQRGAFDATSTALTAGALFYYAPGIIGYSVVKIASPSFYSLMDARTPVLVSVATILANIGLNLWLDRVMGFRGLALGTAIAANLNAVLLLYLLRGRIGGIDGARVLRSLIKITIASAAMGVVAYAAEAWLEAVLPATLFGLGEVPRAIRVFGAIGAALATLALSAWALRLEEFGLVMAQINAKFKMKNAQ